IAAVVSPQFRVERIDHARVVVDDIPAASAALVGVDPAAAAALAAGVIDVRVASDVGGDLGVALQYRHAEAHLSCDFGVGADLLTTHWRQAAIGGTGRVRLTSESQMATTLHGDFDLAGTVLEPVGTFRLDASDLRLGTLLASELKAAGRFDARHLDCETLRADLAAATIDAPFTVDWANGVARVPTLAVISDDLSALGRNLGIREQLAGSARLHGGFAVPLTTAEELADAVSGHLLLIGRDVHVEQTQIDELEVELHAGDGRVVLSRLDIRRGDAVDLILADAAEVVIDGDHWQVPEVTFGGSAGAKFTAAVSGRGGVVEQADLRFDQLPTELALVWSDELPELAGTWAGHFTYHRVDDATPVVDVAVSSSDLAIGGVPAAVNLAARQTKTVNELTECRVLADGGLEVELSGSLPPTVRFPQLLASIERLHHLDSRGHIPLRHPLIRPLLAASTMADWEGALSWTGTMRRVEGEPTVDATVVVAGLGPTAGAIDGHLSLRHDHRGLRLRQVDLSGGDLSLTGDCRLPWAWKAADLYRTDEGQVAWRGGALERVPGRIVVRGDARLPGAHPLLNWALSDHELPAYEGVLTISVSDLPGAEDGVRWLLSGEDLLLAQRPLLLDVMIEQYGDRVVAKRATVDAGDGLRGEATFTLPVHLSDGEWQLRTGAAEGDWNMSGDFSHPLVQRVLGDHVAAGVIHAFGTLADEGGHAVVNATGLEPVLLQSWLGGDHDMAFSGKLALSASPDDWQAVAMATGPCSLSARFDGSSGLDASDLVGSWQTMLAAPYQGHVSAAVDGGEWIADFIPAITALSGRVHASGRLSGSPQQSDWSVRAVGEDITVRTAIDLAVISEGRAVVEIDRDGFDIQRLDALLGYAPASISGTIPLNPTVGDWDLKLDGENVQLIQANGLRMRADVDGTVTGPLDGWVVAGEVGITDLLYSIRTSLFSDSLESVINDEIELFSITSGPLRGLRFDLDVTDGPLRSAANGQVRVANNVVRADLHVDARLEGSGAKPLVVGTISTADAMILLPMSSLRLRRGVLTFDREVPGDPLLDMRAVSRIQGHEVAVTIDGRYSDPGMVVDTFPYLEEEDALALLSTGFTTADLATSATSAAGGMAATYLGRTMLDRFFASSDPDAKPPWWDGIEVAIETDSSDDGIARVSAELPLRDKLFAWTEYLNRSQVEAFNGGLGLRFQADRGVIDDHHHHGATISREEHDVGPQAQWAFTGLDMAQQRAVQVAIRTARRTYDRQGRPLSAVADAAYATQSLLRGDGFANAEVSFSVTDGKGGRPQVELQCHPGERYFLAVVEQVGGTLAGAEYLAALLDEVTWREGVTQMVVGAPLRRGAAANERQRLLPFDVDRLGDLVDSLRSHYRLSGYHDVVVGEPRIRYDLQRPHARVQIPVDAGSRYLIGLGTIAYEQPASAAASAAVMAVLKRAVGTPYRPVVTGQVGRRVQAALADCGHLDATVHTEEVRDDETGVILIAFMIDPGPLHRLGRIDVEWAASTPAAHRRTLPSFVRYRFGLDREAVLDQQAIEAGVRRLYGGGFLRRIDTAVTITEHRAGDDGQPDEVVSDLQVTIDELPARSVDLLVGLGSYDRLIGRIRYLDRNLFGSGRSWEVAPEVSIRGYLIETRLTDRDLLAKHLGPDHRLEWSASYQDREEPTFNHRRWDASVALTRDWTRFWRSAVGYSLARDNASD
ncbi:MAG: translocation/assembly module TamB domain-containing protein, partial [Planctomycetota bacterium]